MNFKHLGCIVAMAAILISIPTSAIALDADIYPDTMDVSVVSAALESNDYSPVTAVAIASAGNQTSLTSYLAAQAQAQAEAEAKAQAEAEAQAQAVAQAKAEAEAKAKAEAEAKEQAALAAAKAKKEAAKKQKAAQKTTPATTTPQKSASTTEKSTTEKPAGIPDKYKVVDSFTVKAYAYSGGGGTASGQKARVGLIAVDPKVIPLGTVLYVQGYGLCVAADTGGDIKGKTVDLYMNTESECNKWGVRHVTCYILK